MTTKSEEFSNAVHILDNAIKYLDRWRSWYGFKDWDTPTAEAKSILSRAYYVLLAEVASPNV